MPLSPQFVCIPQTQIVYVAFLSVFLPWSFVPFALPPSSGFSLANDISFTMLWQLTR
jgi:hypothetical protein